MDTSRQMGTDAEQRFVSIFTEHGHKVTKSSRKQDMYEHWDFLIDGEHKIEVKSRKKSRRHDTRMNDNIIYVEFRNVSGHSGWIYGNADFIAFEQPIGFVIVRRTKLVLLVETLIKHDWADRPTLYKIYKRRDRPDECVGQIATSDLLSLPHKVMT